VKDFLKDNPLLKMIVYFLVYYLIFVGVFSVF
jgi:hypothetical protein